jgi:hypothetical protein
MDERPSDVVQSLESPSFLARRHRAKWLTIIALWSPFLAFISTSILMASLSDNLDKTTLRTREMAAGMGGVLAACGLACGWRALRVGRTVGYGGIFGRAVFGVIANGVLVCFAMIGVVAFFALGKQLEKLNTKQQTPGQLSFEAATARLARTQRTLDHLSTNDQGDAAWVAATSSEFLKQLRMLGDDFAAKTKLINLQLASQVADVTSKDALQAKETVARDYLDANERLAEFSQNRNEIYRQGLIKAGVSSNSIATAMNSFSSQGSTQKPWEANRKLAQAHLTNLQFLETHWGEWSYTNSRIVFQTESLERDYTKLTAQVTQAYEEVVRLQHRTNAP